MEMSAEIINDGMNDATETDSQNEETDKLVSQILDELGCNLRSVLEDAPMGQGISNTTGADLDIRARLDVLKKFDT
jgi:division protein CdvB (Snf7/Vps24/ESCRT-III family)